MKAEQIRKVHCLFEQSGTFKNEFIKLGIPAEDYDIQNNFNQTDHVIDLFAEIEKAYERRTQNAERRTQNAEVCSIFDTMSSSDLIIAFFPCIYFCATSQMNFYITSKNNRNLNTDNLYKGILERAKNRELFLERLIKLCYIATKSKIKLVIENPYSEQTYLKYNFIKAPDVVDSNRMERGDYFKKPTAYWFFNFLPSHGFSYQNDKEQKIINNLAPNGTPGICNEERSMISPDYARNFICDFILGKQQKCIAQQQFEFD